MVVSQNLARLREQTMGSLEDEEAVTVNTRALIDKVLARYSGEWTTLRELIQNAADAQSRNVTIRFETSPSATVPLPQTQDTSELLKHTLLNHTLKTLIVSNDGDFFQETDWQRLKRIAEGNPDETKIGAFGVGFYSVFADCESPFVSSGQESMAFYWKKDSLFTRRGKLPADQAKQGTTFLLDYRSSTTPVPQLLSICQFLATSLTFVGLESIELFLDDWKIVRLAKKMAPGVNVKIPSDVNPKTRDGLMKIVGVEYQHAQIDAEWMNVVAWNRRSQASAASTTSQNDTGSLRSFFGRFTSSVPNTITRKAQREEDALQQSILEDLSGVSKASVFLRLSTVNVQTYVSKQLSQELERATKKPPPKHTRIAILTSSFDESEAALSTVSGNSSKSAAEIFSSVLPTKNGKVFIGFPTAQTTGLLAHISAPSVIPTVERESIDLNARYVRDWNIEMLRVAGIACRIAYTGEMTDLKAKIDRLAAADGRGKVVKADVTTVLPSAIHTYKQYHYAESTPSSRVGQYIEEAFWTCNSKDSIDVLSTCGVLSSQKVRVATEDLSFVEGIPVIPDELMDKARDFLQKLRDYGLLSDITTGDIKKELEAQALSEKQIGELVKWACKKVGQQEMDSGAVQLLFDGTVGSVSEEYISTAPTPVLQLGQIKTFINSAKIPADMPAPSQTIPFRLTKGLTPSQLQSIGWEELQIVPWLRWIVIEGNGRSFGSNQSLTETPAVAAQVLPVVSKAWDGLSQSSKETVQELLMPRTVIPTKMGMRKPPQSYFGNVKLFDDLPTITGLQGVKEKFLSALGVRKTVELNVVFDRLMAKSTSPSAVEEGKWSHVDLIKYLVTVRDDIPPEDVKRLRQTPLCPAETQSGDQVDKGKLFRLSELYQPDDALRKLGLPILQWPGVLRDNTPEARFLKHLGLQVFPGVPELVNILATAGSQLQESAFEYWKVNAYHNGYNRYPVAEIDRAFLPVLPFAGEGKNMIAKPSQCYANPKASVLRFRTLREDLQAHHKLFGVALDPSIETCAERLIKNPPTNTTHAQTLFIYFADRLAEIGVLGNLAERLGSALIVPIPMRTFVEKTPKVRYVSPRGCYLGDSATYGDIFDFVDFGPEANSFLLRIGCKHEPNAAEIASMLVQQPGKLLSMLGVDRYLQLLRKLAENAVNLKKDKALWQQLKGAACLLAVKQVPRPVQDNEKAGNDDDDDLSAVNDYSLARASEVVVVDDFVTYRMFLSSLRTCPQEEVLENFYASLETPWLSRLVEDEQRRGQALRDQTSAAKLQKLLVERCRLFLHDHLADAIRHDGRWLEQNMKVQATEFLQTTHKLKGYKMQVVEKRTAALHRESKRDALLYVTATYDLYEVSRAIMNLLLKRPRQQDFIALETILGSDLRRLKAKGYNVDRILRQKAAESRIAAMAESERQKQEEGQRRVAMTEQANSVVALPTPTNGDNKQPVGTGPPMTPERTLSIPGAFGESAETNTRPGSSGRGKTPSGLFGNISKHLGLHAGSQAGQQMQRMLSNGMRPDLPPPYEAHAPNGGMELAAGTERVTSPQELQTNLESAIKASRAFNSSALFAPPDVKDVKETPSYCDSRPGHDIEFVSQLGSGIKMFLPRGFGDRAGFLQTHGLGIEQFVHILSEAALIFELSAQSIHIFYDESGASIAFNSHGSIFCNLRYFLQLHHAQMAGADGQIEAMAYWFVTLCHELAHNLVAEHSAKHSFYTESFVTHYFRRMIWWASRVTTR